MQRQLAKDFQDLVVWKSHINVFCQFIDTLHHFPNLILVKDLGYGETLQLMTQLEEVSKLLEAYLRSILNSGS